MSFNAKAHLFFLQLIGKGDLTDEKSTSPNPISYQPDGKIRITEASTSSQRPTTVTTTEAPFEWIERWPVEYKNGTHGILLRPVSKTLVEIFDQANEFMTKRGDRKGLTPHPFWIKVYVTKPMEATTITSSDTTIFDTVTLTYDTMNTTTEEQSD